MHQINPVDPPAVDDMEGLAQQILESARRAGQSELKLQGEVDALLRGVLGRYGIDYNPRVNLGLHRSYSTSGRPDSLFGHVVLDYKAPGVLSRPGEVTEAKRQVVEDYLRPICTREGALDTTEAAKWLGVLLDGHTIIFATFDGLENWSWTPVRPISRYTALTLVQSYRALYRKPLDPYLLSEDFGRDSDVAVACIRVLAEYLTHPTPRTTMLFREWRRMFEQVSTYELDQLPSLARWARQRNLPGHRDPSLLLFCLHSYYAIIVKLLKAELVTVSQQFSMQSFFETLSHAGNRDEFLRILQRLETAELFRDLGILNFLEGDFFAWYLHHFDDQLEAALRRVIEVFRTYEPATPKLNPRRCQDLLKVFYSGVIDEQIRHDLGEYYTPDWLGELVLDRVGYEGQIDASLLDPACGSGTFLVLALQRFIRSAQAADLPSAEIITRAATQIQGFDLNPLAVISARANYLLTLTEYLPQYGGGLEIPVYLADCINIPVESLINGVPCLCYSLDTELGPREIAFPTSLVRAQAMSRILYQAEVDSLANRTAETWIRSVREDERTRGLIGQPEEWILTQFYEIVLGLEAREWDEIWCRIIKNHFASQNLSAVDYVVGNPPWVRWSRLPRRYRQRCKAFCRKYGPVSGQNYAGGIESDISTVVTYSAADNWLREGGMLGFLITASVYKSDSASGFRLFELPGAQRIQIPPTQILDLVDLQPFPDATNETSLLVLRKAHAGQNPEAIYPEGGVPYQIWTRNVGQGRIDPQLRLRDVIGRTSRENHCAVPIAAPGSPLFTGTEEDVAAIQAFRGHSPYEGQAHKGTTTDMARVYWVRVLNYDRANRRARIRNLSEEELPGARIEGIHTTQGFWIEGELLYPLIRGREVGRFSYAMNDLYILIPNTHYDQMEDEEAFNRRYRNAFRYFARNQGLLERRATYRRYLRRRPFYAIYDVGDYTFSPFKVVWMEQQNPREFRASVISTFRHSRVPQRIIVPDHKLYMLSLDDETEAHYVCGVLNSRHLRRILGGFLAGKQIGTNVFRYVRVPVFVEGDEMHRRIAEISRQAHATRRGQRVLDDLPLGEQELLDALVNGSFRIADNA